MNIYTADLSSLTHVDWQECLSQLTPRDYAQYTNIKDLKTQKQFLAGRALIYSVLALHKIKKSDFYKKKNGAIAVRTNKIYLSLSHKDTRIILATGLSPIGADIENTATKRDFSALGKIMHFGNTKTAKDFYKKFTAYEASFKYKSITSATPKYYTYKQLDDYLICVVSNTQQDTNFIPMVWTR